jgi:aryl-alcohol dehydrogenase-like predicted oxidoreductase
LQEETMKTRRIDKLEVSEVGLGCNNFGGRLDADATATVVQAALESGITLFDTADIYGGHLSEEYLGQALGQHRAEIVLATKFGMDGGGAPENVRAKADDSLRRLGTDWIDLYQYHFPDPKVPIAETLGAMQELVAAGKARQIGCSNFNAEQLRTARDDAQASPDPGVRFVSVQNQYNVLQREAEAEVLRECKAEGLAFIPYFPLASGLLTGKYRAGQPVPEGTRIAGLPDDRRADVLSDATLARVGELASIAGEDGHSLLDLAFAWLLRTEDVASVIAGATKPEQVLANVAAADWELPADLVSRIDRVAPAT